MLHRGRIHCAENQVQDPFAKGAKLQKEKEFTATTYLPSTALIEKKLYACLVDTSKKLELPDSSETLRSSPILLAKEK